MSDDLPGGRFARHPRLTGAGLVAGALLVLELALRVVSPAPLRFAHEMRRVHGYSRAARVDLRPSQSVRLRVDRSDGQPLFNFRLSTGSEAFRIDERAGPAPPPGARFLHAIGDSYTMGWGVDAASSYPARLARRLEPELRVLNLGVDGFGAIGAIAKSRSLADRFPPAHAVYLFCPNDFEDDRLAEAVARRPPAVHMGWEALDFLRRSSIVAGIPFALRYQLRFRAGPRAAAKQPSQPDPRSLLFEPPELLPSAPGGEATLRALGGYRDFLASRGATLLVLALSRQAESLVAYRFCREQGIEVHLVDLPGPLRIPDEGHFNAAGNDAVAALVAELLRARRDAAAS